MWLPIERYARSRWCAFVRLTSCGRIDSFQSTAGRCDSDVSASQFKLLSGNKFQVIFCAFNFYMNLLSCEWTHSAGRLLTLLSFFDETMMIVIFAWGNSCFEIGSLLKLADFWWKYIRKNMMCSGMRLAFWICDLCTCLFYVNWVVLGLIFECS